MPLANDMSGLSRYCFLENARDLGHLNDVEFTLCSEWFTFFETNFNIDLDLIGIY